MFIYKLGERRLNLEFFVMCEPTTPPGRIRVTMLRGQSFEADEPEATPFLEQIDALRAENFPQSVGGVTRHDESPPAATLREVAT
jgi:hypothetical protein